MSVRRARAQGKRQGKRDVVVQEVAHRHHAVGRVVGAVVHRELTGGTSPLCDDRWKVTKLRELRKRLAYGVEAQTQIVEDRDADPHGVDVPGEEVRAAPGLSGRIVAPLSAMRQKGPDPVVSCTAQSADADLRVSRGRPGHCMVIDFEIFLLRALEVSLGVRLVPHFKVPLVDVVAPRGFAVPHHLAAKALPFPIAFLALRREGVLPALAAVFRRDLRRHAFQHDHGPHAVLHDRVDSLVERLPLVDWIAVGVLRVDARIVDAVVHPDVSEPKTPRMSHGVDLRGRSDAIHVAHVATDPEVAERAALLAEVDGHFGFGEVQLSGRKRLRVVEKLQRNVVEPHGAARFRAPDVAVYGDVSDLAGEQDRSFVVRPVVRSLHQGNIEVSGGLPALVVGDQLKSRPIPGTFSADDLLGLHPPGDPNTSAVVAHKLRSHSAMGRDAERCLAGVLHGVIKANSLLPRKPFPSGGSVRRTLFKSPIGNHVLAPVYSGTDSAEEPNSRHHGKPRESFMRLHLRSFLRIGARGRPRTVSPTPILLSNIEVVMPAESSIMSCTTNNWSYP